MHLLVLVISLSSGHLCDAPRSARLLEAVEAALPAASSLALGAAEGGGGLTTDTRRVLALILGFIPGFGLGHLIARSQDGFVLFLIIDLALYVLWFSVGSALWAPFWGVGGLVWLVVHIIQALDAWSRAGGGRLVQAPARDSRVVLARDARGGPSAGLAPLMLARF